MQLSFVSAATFGGQQIVVRAANALRSLAARRRGSGPRSSGERVNPAIVRSSDLAGPGGPADGFA